MMQYLPFKLGSQCAPAPVKGAFDTPFQTLTKYVEVKLRGYRVRFSQHFRDECLVSVETGDAETGGDSKNGTLFKVLVTERGFNKDDAAQKCYAALMTMTTKI